MANRSKALYDRRRAEGLCVKCPTPSDKTYCERHRSIQSERAKERLALKPTEVRAVKTKYRENNREKIRTGANAKRKDRHLKGEWLEWYIKRYNITIEDYKRMWKKQDGMCAISGCGWLLDSGPKRPHIDHDHETGRFRGLLCYKHNIALGLVSDNIEQLQGLINYLGES